MMAACWFAFTGAEETAHAGLKTLLARRGDELRNASFFGLEGLGGVEVVYLARQGMCFPYQPDAGLLRLDDTLDTLSGQVMEKAVDFVEALLRELDDQSE